MNPFPRLSMNQLHPLSTFNKIAGTISRLVLQLRTRICWWTPAKVAIAMPSLDFRGASSRRVINSPGRWSFIRCMCFFATRFRRFGHRGLRRRSFDRLPRLLYASVMARVDMNKEVRKKKKMELSSFRSISWVQGLL